MVLFLFIMNVDIRKHCSKAGVLPKTVIAKLEEQLQVRCSAADRKPNGQSDLNLRPARAQKNVDTPHPLK